MHWFLLDKLDIHVALDLKSDLLSLAPAVAKKTFKKMIITTNMKDSLDEDSQEVRKAFAAELENKAAMVVKINDEVRLRTPFEKVDHMYVKCDAILQKYLALYALFKLGVV